MSEPKLIVGIKGVAKFLNVSTTRAHVFMTGDKAILPEPYHSNKGKRHEYRCYTAEQLKPVKYLLKLSGKLNVIKAALQYYYELCEAKETISDLKARIQELEYKNRLDEPEEIEQPDEQIDEVGDDVASEEFQNDVLEEDEFEDIDELEEGLKSEDPITMVERQEKNEPDDVQPFQPPQLVFNNES